MLFFLGGGLRLASIELAKGCILWHSKTGHKQYPYSYKKVVLFTKSQQYTESPIPNVEYFKIAMNE